MCTVRQPCHTTKLALLAVRVSGLWKLFVDIDFGKPEPQNIVQLDQNLSDTRKVFRNRKKHSRGRPYIAHNA